MSPPPAGRGGPAAEVAFLWHMHQPPYRDPESGIYLLPWVRLHATRGYLDMAEMHRRHPEVAGTVNFSGVLLDQLADYAAGTARDRFLELSRTPPPDLEEAERAALVDSFFMVSWDRGIRPLPRYWELLEKRGIDASPEERRRAARHFSHQELRDLQVLFNLAWMGFTAREESPVVRELLEKGREFSEEEKAALLAEQQALVAQVLPRWREVARAGRVELSVTPHYHPILPLLCDSASAAEALPDYPLPPRLQAADDAAEQVRLAQAAAERHLGRRSAGMWPAEGSVSAKALAVFAREGVRWVASDEEVLRRSLPASAARGETLFRPWKVRAGEGEVAMVFRDRGLSDLIGFTYARSPAAEAVADLLAHAGRIGAAAPRQHGPPLVSIILDGENPWEYYPDSGRDFLGELFARLARRDEGIATCSIGERLERGLPPGTIERIHAGSWIEGSFRIWMGHPEKLRAWGLVREAKEMLSRAEQEGVHPAGWAAAKENLLAAEASDWFWWFGEDFATESRADFDRLFRHRIAAVFRSLGKDPPVESLSPIAKALGEAEVHKPPIGFIHPRIDGRISSFQEWQGAGSYQVEARREQGAMHRGTALFQRLLYGFDRGHLYLRIDPPSETGRHLRERLQHIDRFEISLRRDGRVQTLLGSWSGDEIYLQGNGQVAGRGKVGSVVELEIPFTSIAVAAGARLGLVVSVRRGGVVVERIPARGFLPLAIGAEDFEQIVWKV